jgi:hypothetical protein
MVTPIKHFEFSKVISQLQEQWCPEHLQQEISLNMKLCLQVKLLNLKLLFIEMPILICFTSEIYAN